VQAQALLPRGRPRRAQGDQRCAGDVGPGHRAGGRRGRDRTL